MDLKPSCSSIAIVPCRPFCDSIATMTDSITTTASLQSAESIGTCCTCQKDVYEISEDCTRVSTRQGQDGDQVDTLRCSACNSCMSRLKRLFENNIELKANWDRVGKKQKQELIADAGDLQGVALAKAVEDVVTQRSVQSQVSHFAANDRFLDEPDVRKEFAAKPSVRDSILKNAFKFECTITQRVMYAIPTYERQKMDKTTNEEERSISITASSKIKAQKSLEAKTAAKDKAAAKESKPGGLTPANVKKVELHKGKMATAIGPAKESLASVREEGAVATRLPAEVLQDCTTRIQELETHQEAAGVLLEAENAVDQTTAILNLLSEGGALKVSLKASIMLLTSQANMVRKALSPGAETLATDQSNATTKAKGGKKANAKAKAK